MLVCEEVVGVNEQKPLPLTGCRCALVVTSSRAVIPTHHSRDQMQFLKDTTLRNG